MGNQQSEPVPVPTPAGPQLGKSGKKICCSCPDTRKLRDACIMEKGDENCAALIEAHKVCLRLEGFAMP
ncbi:cytochrome c oxidase copper chaperone [Pelagophyceae sp. CCMP2097]|nr:cytochrome c oxidase copper chaperone [Pelagophyceae sp. CCMP2097]